MKIITGESEVYMSQEISKSKEWILSVDAGTQSIRAALVDMEGNIVQIVKTPIQPYFSKHNGYPHCYRRQSQDFLY